MTCFYITVNRPGFLPDDMGDALGCETLDDAREALASEIARTEEESFWRDDSYQPDVVAGAIALAEALDTAATLQPGESVLFAGFAHSITESAEAF